GRVAAEFPLPELIIQHDRRRRTAAQVVLGAKQASGGRRDPQRGKKIAGNSENLHAARPLALADTQICVSAIPGEYARNRLLVLADLLKQRIAEIVGILRDAEAADAGAALAGNLDEDQPVRFRYRQTSQAYGIQKLKYRRVGADPERQRGDRSQGEGRR